MEYILPESEATEVESRLYSNPQIGIEETSDFIEKLRATQGQQNQEIAQQTQRLGTDVPTNLGGLTGADSYFTSRYQAPQTLSNVANLRAAAQASALNDVLANEQAIWKKRYQDAYRNYQKRQYNRAKRAYGGGGSGGNTGGNDGNTSTWGGEVETEESPTTTSYGVPGADVTETDTHYVYTDPKTGEKVYVSKDYMNKIYDKNGNITDEGAVILDTRRMLGL